MKKTWIIFFLFLLTVSACQGETTTPRDEDSTSSNGNSPSILRTATNQEQKTSEKVEATINKEHEFQEVTAVNSDDLIVIGIDPMHHDRFQLKKLRNDLKSTVESSFRAYDVELSTDKKITLELKKLKEQIAEDGLSQEQLKKELERIRDLSKEQT